MQQQAKDEWLRGVKCIADFLGVGERTVKRWLLTDQTDFPVSRIGGRWVAHTDDLRRWMRRRGAAA
jgi:hypothetical protein